MPSPLVNDAARRSGAIYRALFVRGVAQELARRRFSSANVFD